MQLLTYGKFLYARRNNDTGQNGGLSSNREIPAGSFESIFPSVLENALANGKTDYRKVFLRLTNFDDNALLGSFLGLLSKSGPPKMLVLRGFPVHERSTHQTTQSDVESTTGYYGSGVLDADANGGDTTITVQVDDVDDGTFQDGDDIIIVSEDEQTMIHSKVSTASGDSASNIYTLTLETDLPTSFSAGAYVFSISPPVTVKAEMTSSVTSTNGTFDESKVSLTNAGVETHVVTLTFVSSTSFTITSDVFGDLGTGSISDTTAPANTYRGGGASFFSIDSSAFGGSWEAGDTITMTFTAAEMAIWLKRVVQAGTAAFDLANLDIYAGGSGAA